MSNKTLHVISFDVPYPANYGGVIDVFYKIKALHLLGVKVILHCFQYGRESHGRLEDFCEQVHYYKRSGGLFKHLSLTPYIVNSRDSKRLLAELLKDTHPILFEGLHSTYFLSHSALTARPKWVRMHNIEHDYYTGLSLVEKHPFRKLFFKTEAVKLKRYEKVLHKAQGLFAISNNDDAYLKSVYQHAVYLPAFHPNESIQSLEGKGDYALYHGNLAVGENQEAVKYLVEEVFAHSTIPFVIAGGGAPAWLGDLIRNFKHITLDKQADMEHIKQLLQRAHVNVLPTFQPTGIKLKLLFALFNGRHCVVNSPMVEHTGLASFCVIEDEPRKMKNTIEKLFEKDFTLEDKVFRQKLETQFSSKIAAEQLIKAIWNL